MNIFTRHWPKFKQEFFPIIYASIAQVFCIAHHPAFTRLDDSWNTFLVAVISFIAVAGIIVAFSSANTFAQSFFNFNYLNAYSHRPIFKIAETVFLIATGSIAIAMWNKSFDQMSNMHYVIFYVNAVVAFILFSRAVHRKPLAT